MKHSNPTSEDSLKDESTDTPEALAREHTDREFKSAIDDQMMKRLDRDFMYHPPRDGQPRRYRDIRATGKMFAAMVVSTCPPGRERAVALTKIEEAVMWANAGIAREAVE